MTTDDGAADEDATEPAAAVAAAPVLRVVRGDPESDELAALLAVLATRSSPVPAPSDARPSSWAAYWRGHRQPLRPAPDGWRASSRPR